MSFFVLSERRFLIYFLFFAKFTVFFLFYHLSFSLISISNLKQAELISHMLAVLSFALLFPLCLGQEWLVGSMFDDATSNPPCLDPLAERKPFWRLITPI